jgi:hypothetical protein
MADAVIAFSSEVATGSREENASKQKSGASVLISIGADNALAAIALAAPGARISNFALMGTR